MLDKYLSHILTQLAFDEPFFATLLGMTPLIEDSRVSTMATDGLNVYYNPVFLESLDEDEALGVLLHEFLHIVYLHCSKSRRISREPKRWNIASDFAVNQEIKAWGYKLPKNALLDRRFYGMTTEQIYELVQPNPSSSCLDVLLPISDGTESKIIGRIMVAADTFPSHVPHEVARWIARLKASRVPWQRVLQRFLRESLGREQQSFLPPNRRHLWDGRYIPSIMKCVRGKLVLAVDTSGSITPSLLQDFASEIAAIADLCQDLILLTCDAKVHQVVRLPGLRSFLGRLCFTGGGGTDFRPVFEYVGSNKLRPDALVYLTDGLGEFPATPPKDFSVLWCLTQPIRVPWGQTVTLPGG